MNTFIGQVLLFAGDYAPKGWSICDGSLLNISDYPELFIVLGTTYGGDGITTFKLPDLRGRVAVGTGTGSGLTQRNSGDIGGSESNTLSENNLPAHDHNVSASVSLGTVSNQPSGNGNFLPISVGANFYSSAQSTAQLNPATIDVSEDSVGSGDAVNNMPPFQSLNYIIAIEGNFPFKTV
jgi:microcystin-dependent protein